MSARADVLVFAGEAEPRIQALRSAGVDQTSITVSFPLDGSTASVTFTAERFLAFVEQLRQFAEGLPKPS